ncbi:MAG: hypothetical protein H8E49_14695 [Gammaproteobacteria bacterium]|nr:hypothetical protein [Gammaproteobacteria bacterium]
MKRIPLEKKTIPKLEKMQRVPIKELNCKINKVEWNLKKRIKDKSIESREIEIKTKEFLRRGGAIEVLPILSGVKQIYQCFGFNRPESETIDKSEYKRREHA